MTSYELASILVGFFTLVVALLAFLQSSISKITSIGSADRANNLAELALKISLQEYKKKILPDFIAYSKIINLSIKDSNNYNIELLIKSKTHSKAKIVSLSVAGPFSEGVNFNEPVDLFLNNELSIDLVFNHGVFERIKGQTLELANKSQFNDSDIDTEFRRLVNIELTRMKIFIGYTDELNNSYIMPMKYNFKASRHSVDGEFIGEPIERPDLN
ncbi:MAG TPA: hypothetical protein PLJ08_10465 [Cyclobacteriaceae bacterium]|nr:hypothetical protein [Cyclobacteriaceae bacterium]